MNTFGQIIYLKLDAKDFSDKLNSSDSIQIIDVRTNNEFSKSHLKNAKNINLIGRHFKTKISELDKNKPVFVYCLSGHRSTFAVNKIKKTGIKEIYELNGGLQKWRKAKLPEVSD